jgi:Cu/Zn superoxide dismutase
MQCVIGIEAENVNGTLPPMPINGTVPYVTRATAVMRRTNLTSLTSVDGFFDFALDRARNDTVVTYWLAGLQAGTPYEVYVNTGGNECDGESALQINSSGVFVGDCNACRASLGPSINRVGNIRDSIFIVPDADGRARGAFRDAVVKLNGTNSIVGRSVVLRRRPDAGTLVAWGLIGRAQEEYYPLAFAPPFVQHASCRLQPTLLGNANITGYFAFSYDLSLAAVRVKYFARGLAPGQHRYSVNQYGDMFGADRALGTRGVFMGAPVRPRPPQQPQAVGAIDDGVPLVAGTEGQSFGSFIDYNLQLNDFNSIVGRGLVIYGNETDADVAVAQCVIGIAGEVPRDPFPTCPDLPQDPPQAICALASTSTSSRPVTGTVEIVALSDTQHKVTVKACGLSEGTHRWFVAAGGDIWQRDGTSPGDAFAGVCSNCRPSLPGNLQQVGRLGDDRLLTVPANSTCVFDTFFDSVIRLSGLNSVVGRAVVIFEAQAVNPALRVAQCVLGRSDFFSVDAFHASRPNVTRATVKFTNTSLAPEAIGGYMVFEDLGESVGVEMRFFMWGISMGRPHEFHVHLKGDVTDPRGNAVEGHFIGACNNTCRPQGILQEVGKVGDDYEMRARDKVTRGRIIDRVIKLNGPDSIVGRSVIIHGDGPNSGTHIAQGVIGIAREGVTADPPAVIGGTDPLVTRAQVILDSTNVTGALPLVGWVEMELVPGTHTVELTYSISGLSPGNHSWAITQRGDLCLQNGSSPGVTFVGTCSNCRPGGPQQVGAIGGGAPILADAFGVAEGRLRDPVLRFNDTNSIIGRALVVRGSVLRADDVVAQGVVGRVIEHPTRRGLPAPPVAEASCRMIPTYVISPAEQPVDIEGYVHLRRDEAIGRTVFTFRMARLPPGPHRWAIHASGDIISEDTGKSTRDVFVGNSTRQVGLIGDGAPLVASSFGTAQGVVLDAHALLTGANSVIGRSIVVFGNGLPGGDNVRIAFCVIGINSENASAPQTCALQEARPDPEESSASEGLSDTNVAIIIGISAVAFGLLLALLYSWWHRRHGGDRAAKNTAKMTAVATTELSPAPAPQAQGGFRPAAVVAGTAAGGTAVSAPEAVYGEWEMHRDDEGNPYYYNPRTQESRWEVPH